ncbi:transposable element Tcb1 transposase [Trichonephila clavipes]|nr:transposable element Tcb1 transposase [Trichonephila clavipes]
MDWPARFLDLNPIEHVWDVLGRRLAARTLPPVTIRELRLALQDEWAAMPQQLIDTLILSMGRRCETCLAVREIISPTKDRMFLAGHPSQGCFGLQSHCVPCYFFNQASFYPCDFSFSTHTTVSRQTVYRRLGHIGLYARRPVTYVPLTATHCRLRLTWSRQHALRTTEQWSCVMFSDESRTDLHDQSVTMTGHIYLDVILEQHVHLFRGAMGAEFLFIDDNALPHRANIVAECLKSEDITRMD